MATIVVCHGAWSAGWAWKKVRPLLRAAGHDVFTPTYTGLGERAHQVSRAINLDTHIADVLAVLECEDLRDVVLVGHSYGGMVATGVADRAAERICQARLPRRVRAGERAEPVRPAARLRRGLAQEDARVSGDGWLLPPNPTPPDTSPEDVAWITPRRRWQPIGCFAQPLILKNAQRPSAAHLHLLHAHRARRHVRPVRQALPLRPGVAVLRDRCQPQPQRHGAGGAGATPRPDRPMSSDDRRRAKPRQETGNGWPRPSRG